MNKTDLVPALWSLQAGGVRHESHNRTHKYEVWYGQGREVCEAVREHKVGGAWGSQKSSLRKVMGTSSGKNSRQRAERGGQHGEQGGAGGR